MFLCLESCATDAATLVRTLALAPSTLSVNSVDCAVESTVTAREADRCDTALFTGLPAAPSPGAVAKGLVRQLLRALVHAHAHGLAHWDVKPYNLLVARAGAAKLADWGGARAVRDDGAVAVGKGDAVPVSAHTVTLPAVTLPAVTLWYRPPELLLPSLAPHPLASPCVAHPRTVPAGSAAHGHSDFPVHSHSDAEADAAADAAADYAAGSDAAAHGRCAVDLWAAGCVWAELLRGGRPLMRADTEWRQLQRIVALTGDLAVPAQQAPQQQSRHSESGAQSLAGAQTGPICEESSGMAVAVEMVLAAARATAAAKAGAKAAKAKTKAGDSDDAVAPVAVAGGASSSATDSLIEITNENDDHESRFTQALLKAVTPATFNPTLTSHSHVSSPLESQSQPQPQLQPQLQSQSQSQ